MVSSAGQKQNKCGAKCHVFVQAFAVRAKLKKQQLLKSHRPSLPEGDRTVPVRYADLCMETPS